MPLPSRHIVPEIESCHSSIFTFAFFCAFCAVSNFESSAVKNRKKLRLKTAGDTSGDDGRSLADLLTNPRSATMLPTRSVSIWWLYKSAQKISLCRACAHFVNRVKKREVRHTCQRKTYNNIWRAFSYPPSRATPSRGSATPVGSSRSSMITSVLHRLKITTL